MRKRYRRLLSMALAILLALSLAAFAAAEEGAVYSDVIAGIDPGSVVVEGDTTFFTSVMNGEAVRFEGTDISVGEDGITLKPYGKLVSLDAIGRISAYQISVADGEDARVGEQFLDIGYGYMNSAERTSAARASDIYASPLMGWPVSAWNENSGLSIAEFAPNFVFVQSASANTEALTLKSLTVGYDPSERFTGIEIPRSVLPQHFDDFESFFENADEALEEAHAPAGQEEPNAAETDTVYADVVAGIDYGSIYEEDGSTFFVSVMNGEAVRFEGRGVSVGEDGITLAFEGTLTSLDSIGTIRDYRISMREDDASADEAWLGIGFGYADSADKINAERADALHTAVFIVRSAADWNRGEAESVAGLEPNFVFVQGMGARRAEVTVTSLTVGYDPSDRYTDIELAKKRLPGHFADDEPSGEPAQSSDDEPFDEPDESVQPVDAEPFAEPAREEPRSADDWTEIKMAEEGALVSDVIAGIDPSSVSERDGAVFFRSVMSDGTVIRFEGKGVSVGEEGIVMSPGGSLTSLDAVGQIYKYAASVKDGGEPTLRVGYGYTFSADKISVERAGDVFTHEISGYPAFVWNEGADISTAFYEPNFVYVVAAGYNSEEFTLTGLTIGYNPAQKATALTDAELYSPQYGYYADGEPYNAAKETKANADRREYEFYLILRQESLDEMNVSEGDRRLYFLPAEFYTVGDLKDAEGSVLDKRTARVHEGCTLDVTVGDYTFALNLPMAETYEGVQTLREARPYSTLTAVGSQNALVVPIVWADQTELADDETYALYQRALGRLIDEKGNPLGDFSSAEDEVFSLTEYFEIASYGQLELSSFMTDWYYTDKTFANDYEYVFPEVEFADEVLEWVKTAYPSTDWTRFDQDGDGCVDAIVLLSVGLTQNDGYMPASFGGAVHSTGSYFGMAGGTQQNPRANCFLTVNHRYLKDGETHGLIHEFSHSFGLNDYYDGSGSGVNAVGGYDMQGSSVGDWNAYSKLAVGWMNPQVVTGLASGESVELTIGSSALTGDVIILPAAGTEYDGPFGEYVMLDLLTPDGVNAYDAAEYGLEKTVGVRISHVNARMKRTAETEGVIGYVEDHGRVIGMELHDNNYAEDGFGLYSLEVIQAGGKNTFTSLSNLYPYLRAGDLFYAGDTFAAEDYAQFFYDGLMDNGLPLGYTVRILSVGTDAEGKPTASIRITAN